MLPGQGNLLFADLSGELASQGVTSHNTATKVSLMLPGGVVVDAYYFPFVMPAGNVGKTYQ